MVSKKTAGDRVREMRLQKGWSQTELARRLEVSQPRIAQIEAAKHLRTANAIQLAELLGCNPGWLLTGS